MFEYRVKPLDTPDGIDKLKKALNDADAIVLGAGAGLSTAAGYTYAGERFEKYFSDFADRYHFSDMYSGGFYVLDLPPEKMWAYWSRNIWINRYAPIPSDFYKRLFEVVKDRDYFVITTNVDHCFQRAGFDRKRLFYTQGDYGLFQSSDPKGITKEKTYDNEDIVRRMLLAQGFEIAEDNSLIVPEAGKIEMTVPAELVPYCPDDGRPMMMNLRSDERFVEDEGWHQAAERYSSFLRSHQDNKVLFLEIGVGMNTPTIIKYAFWQMTAGWDKAVYACLNRGEAYAPEDIIDRSICINDDFRNVIDQLLSGQRPV
ncbi:MAG: hypothetical protein IKF68_04885 [Erysipelotrichaceae bacterium]|nr:hypothetical protein [Erysipelotrichaceae bacterium]